MELRLLFKISFRYFRSKHNDKFISFIAKFSLIGIALGVAALIVITSIMNGFHDALVKNIVGLNSHIMWYGKDIELAKRANFVSSANRSIVSQALGMSQSNTYGILIKGLDLQDILSKAQITNNINGDPSLLQDNNHVLIGSGLAQNLKVGLNDKIRIMSAKTISGILGQIPRTKEFVVAGIFSTGLYDYDNMIAIASFDVVSKMLLDQGAFVEVYVDDLDQANQYATKLEELYGFRAVSWQEANKQFLGALKIEKVAMVSVLSLIVVVAIFNIISGLFMLVRDKTCDIAILRTMGASKKFVMMIFMLNGIYVGLCGTIIGGALGTIASYNIDSIKQFIERFAHIKIFEAAVYFLYYLPSKIYISDVLIICSASIALCTFATIYPAYRASSLNPVTAIRGE